MWLGTVLVLVSSIAFSAKAVMAKLLYREGLDPETVLALRMGLSLPVFLFSAWRTERRAEPLTRNRLVAIALLGSVLYYGSALADFWGLRFVSAGLERLILFTYPSWVLLLSWLVLKDRVRGQQLLALALSYSGIALAVTGEHSEDTHTLLGGALVLGSAVAYAAYLVGGTRYIRAIGAERFTALALSAACLAALLHFGVSHRSLPHFSPRIGVLGLAMALLSTVLPAFALAGGIRRIGPTSAAIVGTVGPVSTLGMAFLFLGEPISPTQVLGTGLVLAGVSWLTLWRRG